MSAAFWLWQGTRRSDGLYVVSHLEVRRASCYRIFSSQNRSTVIFFVTLLHGLTPKLGVYVMNVSCACYHAPWFIFLTPRFTGPQRVQDCDPAFCRDHGCAFFVSFGGMRLTDRTGWVVLSGHTRVADPHANFRNAFAGSSHSGNDVSENDVTPA